MEIRCEVVTPMFSRGADYSFELRPQSIKGVLRFWFRAISPTVIDIYTLEGLENLSGKEKRKWEKEKYKGLKYLESLIFGSQERKAPFGLKVRTYDEPKPLGTFRERNGKGYKIEIYNPLRKLRYFLYGLYDEKSKTSYEYLPSRARFSVSLHTRDEIIKDIVLKLFQLISTFSGFGAKTRKGFGAFRIIDPELDRNEYRGAIEDCRETIKKFVSEYNSKNTVRLILKKTVFNGIPDFPNFCDCRIFKIPTDTTNWHEALKSASDTYSFLKKDLRYSNGDCVKDLIEALRGKKREVNIPPAVMGLPLQYQNLKNLRGLKVTISPSLKDLKIDKPGRKASPLFLSVHENEKGKWDLIVLLMRSKVTADKNGKLRVSGHNVIVTVNEEEAYARLCNYLRNLGEEIWGDVHE